MTQFHVDPATGRRFYVDPATGRSHWEHETASPNPYATQGFSQQHAASPTQLSRPLAAGAPDSAMGHPTQLYRFDGGAASYFGVALLAFLVTVFSLGLLLPLAVVMQYSWRAEHTWLYGRRLRFTGSALELFGHWLAMWVLCLITFGIYSFWVVPRITKWAVEHQQFA